MRIVSLLPSATEILFAIGAGDELVGVTHECDFPPEALRLPQLTSSALPQAARSIDIDRHVRRALHEGSSLYHLDADLLERIAPDLIVTQELCEVCAVSYAIVDRAARRLESDPRVVSLEPSSLDDVFANILYLGEITCRAESALAGVSALRSRVDILREATDDAAIRPRTLVLEWIDPPMSGGHWTPQLVELAGGTPVLAHPGSNSVRLEWSDIEEADADAIVVVPCGFDLGKTRAAVAELSANARWNRLRAVRANRVFEMDGNAYVNRPGPRLVDSAEMIAQFLGSPASATL